VKISSRNLWIEITALGLVLASLLCFLLAFYCVTIFTVNEMLPNEPPLQSRGWVLGLNETVGSALSFGIPGVILVGAAWSLRSLLAEKDGAEE
jgi:hypothetical protein